MPSSPHFSMTRVGLSRNRLGAGLRDMAGTERPLGSTGIARMVVSEGGLIRIYFVVAGA